MKTTKKQNKKYESVTIETDGKQAWFKINGIQLHINAFDKEHLDITTFSISKVTLRTSNETEVLPKTY